MIKRFIIGKRLFCNGERAAGKPRFPGSETPFALVRRRMRRSAPHVAPVPYVAPAPHVVPDTAYDTLPRCKTGGNPYTYSASARSMRLVTPVRFRPTMYCLIGRLMCSITKRWPSMSCAARLRYSLATSAFTSSSLNT